MELHTTKFGTVCVDQRDLLRFPDGLIGYENARDWVLLTETLDSSICWLQSVNFGELAVPMVTPSRYVPQYRVRVDAEELQTLEIERDRDVEVLVVLSQHRDLPSINLKAPLVINMASRIGRQVVDTGNWSVRHMIAAVAGNLRQTA